MTPALVHLALYKGRGLPGNAIVRWWTRSTYSHCEIAIGGTGYSSSVMDGGVRAKRIDWQNGNWDLVPMPWANAAAILAYFEATEGHRYGWLDLVRSQVFNGVRDQPRAAFCSEWCLASAGVVSPTLYSPATAAELVKFINRIVQ